MNRLRGRKKAKDEPAPRPSIDSEASGPFKMFGRSKKTIEEPKPDVDITAALPSSDDFRTSLLMTGLSARFSMLREQDDPTSKIGKASDDSVLYPKRQSRADFGLGTGLHDIAEDRSIRGPDFGRINSFQSSDDASSISGSMMNRGKPTEGNNLFGGRQKIYKITSSGGNGRTLYDDDVAASAFQRWRQAEKGRKSPEAETEGYEPGSLRPASPQDYNRRRETSSTMSSGPSVGRNSTAATSVVSQPASSVKDWQAGLSTPSSATSAAFPERSVTRTRRLYEQTLNQDMQDHQSSALHRIDTLSRRNLGNRTPDLPYNSSSTTNLAATERANDRRPHIMSKASAPNLRSFSPPSINSPQPSLYENSSKFTAPESKPSPIVSPPLSPPLSEGEEHPSLPIGPNDRGKATALGFFSRPAQQYDDARYAQRQQQLQQGRNTPTSRERTGSDVSIPTTGSRSSSLSRERNDRNPRPGAPNSSVLASSTKNGEVNSNAPCSASGTPQVTVARPDDQEHPLFKSSAVPEPLTLPAKTYEGESKKTPDESPNDSPTLGPGAGLSGMVRQHLRNVSNASSVYGGQDEPNNRNSIYGNGNQMGHLAMDSNPWGSDNGDHDNSVIREIDEVSLGEPAATSQGETDEFARHLADGARRVRERLTSYVDSDQSRSTSPAAPQTDRTESAEEPTTSRSGAFSVLRSKSSRGSLADKRRDRSRSRAPKVPALPYSEVPSPSTKPSFDGHDLPRSEDSIDGGTRASEDSSSQPDKENASAGLKAFRQARRELQRMKEAETQQRRQAPSGPPGQYRSPNQSLDRGPPPVSYGRVPSDGTSSRPGSRAPSERDRSGSEASNGGQPHYRPRLRTASSAYEERMSNDSRRSPINPPYSSYSDITPGVSSRPGSSSNGLVTATHSTPNLPISPSMPPPLPPINPRRKGGMNSPSLRDEDRMPLSPDRAMGGRGGNFRMSDDENGPGQYRQRLRKATSEMNGVGSRGRPERVSPPYPGARPGPEHIISNGDAPQGMI